MVVTWPVVALTRRIPVSRDQDRREDRNLPHGRALYERGRTVVTASMRQRLTPHLALVASILLAVLATAAFTPLKRRVQDIVDRRCKAEPSALMAGATASE